MTSKTTWEPLAEPYDRNDNGKLDPRERRSLPDSAFAFPAERELPLVDAEFVRAAIAGFERGDGPASSTATDREVALSNIREAAAYYGVAMSEKGGARL